MSSNQTGDALPVEVKRKAAYVFGDAYVQKYRKDVTGGYYPVRSLDVQQAESRHNAAAELYHEVLALTENDALIGQGAHKAFIVHFFTMLIMALWRRSRWSHLTDAKQALAAATDDPTVIGDWRALVDAWLNGSADDIVLAVRMLLQSWWSLVAQPRM